MFVLGIDPGVSRCGYGLLDTSGPTPLAVSAGLLTTPISDELPQRLATLGRDLRELMNEMRPDAVVVERVFFQTNVRTAMSVGQASGLALATAAQLGCMVSQYTSNEVKLAVAGDGAASKKQVQQMVQRLLGLDVTPDPPDVADALALALTHASQSSWQQKVTAARVAAGQDARG